SLAYRMGTGGALDAVREAFNSGLIVRGYPMRGTVFVTSSADLAWITQLCGAPRIKAMEKNRPRLGLNNSHVDLATQIIHEVAGKRFISRAVLFEAFVPAGIPMTHCNVYHLVRSM